jgi:diacylglycerol kinase family enzyme/membrane-associated phospholipid phosphatase
MPINPLVKRLAFRLAGQPYRRHLPEPLQRADLQVFRAVHEAHSPTFDRVLPALSRAANHSVLWVAIAAGMAAFGGRAGRRAAMRGLLTVGVTSAVTNGPVKLLVRRHRPDSATVPMARRLARMPISSSFPSGHSASAAAFAVGASLELPKLGVPLGTLAAGVGASRVYVGVHYPLDVLAGFALGAGAAVATTRFWPRVPIQREAGRALREASAPALPDGEGLALVVNPSAGSVWQKDVAIQVKEALPKAQLIEAADGDDLQKILEKAATDATVLGIAGGDGSCNAAADVARRLGLPLLVVPAGTLNHFARDLRLDSVRHAIDAVREGSATTVEVGIIDGKPFLNTASFGSYPEVVDARERMEDRLGKWPALVLALGRTLRRVEPMPVEMNGLKRRLWMVFIGNCRYEPRGFAPVVRQRLDDGEFDVRLVDAAPRWSRTRLLGALLTGRLYRTPVYEERIDGRIEIESLDGPVRLARDGETFDGSKKFTIEKAPERLVVYARLQSRR